jgi:putative methionine-R-sulfoxide reductase with GAF domain
MTAHSTPDPESFQRLLSNAFDVQESGMDTKSLSAIVELQRSIATRELDVDGAMDLIAVRAQNIANATGIAIGLLQGDQLVYRAGSGSAETYVGQRVMATLCVPAHNAARREILRVENAQSDARIEAAICRQFGARSLLILPIYHDRTVVGVLDVLFTVEHAFQYREVHSYWLMAALVGEAMSYAARPEQEKALAADPSTMRRSIKLACGSSIGEPGKVAALSELAWVASKRAKRVPSYKGRWETAVAFAAVLVIASWIGYRDRRSGSPLGASTLQGANALQQQMPFVPAKRALVNSTAKPKTAGLEEEEKKAARTAPQRVLDRNSLVRYFSEDVTVRYFAPQPAPQRVLDRNSLVRHISEDVTVRYFTPQPAAQPVSR